MTNLWMKLQLWDKANKQSAVSDREADQEKKERDKQNKLSDEGMKSWNAFNKITAAEDGNGSLTLLKIWVVFNTCHKYCTYIMMLYWGQ